MGPGFRALGFWALGGFGDVLKLAGSCASSVFSLSLNVATLPMGFWGFASFGCGNGYRFEIGV